VACERRAVADARTARAPRHRCLARQVRNAAGLLLKNNLKQQYTTTTEDFRSYIKVRPGGLGQGWCRKSIGLEEIAGLSLCGRSQQAVRGGGEGMA
jgi:hypothetical protein